MSGIVGIYNLDKSPVAAKHLHSMLDVLAHRGPDGVDTWLNGPVGLGHRMLWTTPESLVERLPSTRRKLSITADARIDNRDELIPLLGFDDCPIEKITDSDVILAAYEKWGETCPDKLLGDFAFSIWDEHSQTLFCARDHFGIKPFYYYLSDSIFIFATEIKSVLSHPVVSKRLNDQRIGSFLSSETVEDKTATFFKDIFRLLPAHCLSVSRDGCVSRSYWELDPHHEISPMSDEQYAHTFREIFTEAVRCRLRSAFPVGSMLSGGLDSSSVTCVAAQLGAQAGASSLSTFSAVFDTVTQCDERGFQKTVLEQGNFNPYYFHADKVSPLADLEKVLWHQDDCFTMDNGYIVWHFCRMAKEKGIRVLLSGFDGDNTVSHGKGYFVELAYQRRWLKLRKAMKSYGRRMSTDWKPAFRQYILKYGLKPFLSKLFLLKGARYVGHFSKKVVPTYESSDEHSRSDSILNEEFSNQLNSRATPRTPQRASYSQRYDHYHSLKNYRLAEALEMLDGMAGAFSVESRFPFWDKRLIEFCLALPPEQKLRQGWSRMILRQAMEGILPEEVQWRSGKSNLQHNYEHGILTFEYERLKKIILNEPERIERYINIRTLRNSFNRFVANNAKGSDLINIMQVLSFAVWLRENKCS